jgi:outer membrane protein assembly factor BamB
MHGTLVRQVTHVQPPLGLALTALIGLIALGDARPTSAGDWPQILGPHRNGQADDEKLPEAWPKGGPKTLWTYDVGSGFAGPAVVGQRVILFHRVGDAERIEAISTTTGKSLWKADFAASYRGTINPDDGPRCVPVIHGDAVYVYGAAGDVHSVELASGKKRWSRAALADYGAPEGYFGAGSTPIVAGDALLVNVGGRAGSGIVAFNLADGKTRWKASDEQASYSSPTLVDVGGRPHVVFVTRLNALVVNPANGEILSSIPFGQRGPTVNAATPLVFNDRLFLTASYSIGARLLDVKPDELAEVWSSDEVLSSQYNTPVMRDGKLYGIHGREDIGEAELRCVDLAAQRVHWSEKDFGVAHLILAGDKLLLARINGELVLARASPEKFTALGRAKICDGMMRAIPALSNGRCYVRDERVLKCVEVGK